MRIIDFQTLNRPQRFKNSCKFDCLMHWKSLTMRQELLQRLRFSMVTMHTHTSAQTCYNHVRVFFCHCHKLLTEWKRRQLAIRNKRFVFDDKMNDWPRAQCCSKFTANGLLQNCIDSVWPEIILLHSCDWIMFLVIYWNSAMMYITMNTQEHFSAWTHNPNVDQRFDVWDGGMGAFCSSAKSWNVYKPNPPKGCIEEWCNRRGFFKSVRLRSFSPWS